jgi:hypothetical protein
MSTQWLSAWWTRESDVEIDPPPEGNVARDRSGGLRYPSLKEGRQFPEARWRTRAIGDEIIGCPQQVGAVLLYFCKRNINILPRFFRA